MKILILGGSGFIGQCLARLLQASAEFEIVSASRRLTSLQQLPIQYLSLDTLCQTDLQRALQGVDCVVNCVAGDAKSIAEGAKILVNAMLTANCRQLVHLSSMAVYGGFEGVASETTHLVEQAGWYAMAKCEAEQQVRQFVKQGGSAVIFRPGCVYGEGSEQWVGRIGRLIRQRRLGDLGINGDGWSNLIHVDDLCQAIQKVLTQNCNETLRIYNLAAADSPRWNQYFMDFGLAIAATPLPRVTLRQLKADAYFCGPPLKLMQKLAVRLKPTQTSLPDPLPPGLVRYFKQDIKVDAALVTKQLNLTTMPYATGLQRSVTWFLSQK